MSATGGPDIVEDGLVLALDAANVKSYPGSGTTWSDLSGNGNNGTLINGVGFNSDNLGSLVFDGVNDSVQIPKVSSINFTPLDSFTMNVWAKVNNVGDAPTLNRVGTIFGRGSTARSVGIGMLRNSSGVFGWRVGSRAVGQISTALSYSVGRIDYITLVYTPTFQHIYLNGEIINTQNTSAGTAGSFQNTFYAMGLNRAVPGGDGGFVDGAVYSATMYNKSLTAQEVLQNYNATKGRYGL